MSNETNNDEYKPTYAEEKLIEVLSNPEHLGKTITEKCKIADISRDMFYRVMKKPGFIKYYNNLMIEVIKGKVGDIINATAKFAQLPKNHQDRKLLLEMANIYTPKEKMEISGENGEALNVTFNISRPPKEEKNYEPKD